MIIKSTNVFSSFIKMKFCSNLKDTMYFLSFFAFARTKVGVGDKKEMAHVYIFVSE